MGNTISQSFSSNCPCTVYPLPSLADLCPCPCPPWRKPQLPCPGPQHHDRTCHGCIRAKTLEIWATHKLGLQLRDSATLARQMLRAAAGEKARDEEFDRVTPEKFRVGLAKGEWGMVGWVEEMREFLGLPVDEGLLGYRQFIVHGAERKVKGVDLGEEGTTEVRVVREEDREKGGLEEVQGGGGEEIQLNVGGRRSTEVRMVEVGARKPRDVKGVEQEELKRVGKEAAVQVGETVAWW